MALFAQRARSITVSARMVRSVVVDARFDRRDNNINFLRLALALIVVYGHGYAITGAADQELFLRLTGGQAGAGPIAVDSFFILSGFLMVPSFERSSSALNFLKKRIARIYPAFIALTLVTVVCFCPLGGGILEGHGIGKTALVASSAIRLKDIKTVGAFFHNPYPHVINASLWSISYEFWCYIAVLVLGMTGLLRRRRLLLWMLGLSIVNGWLFFHFGWHAGKNICTVIFGYPEAWARLIPMYIAGIVFYRYRDRIEIKPLFVLVSIIVLGFGSCFLRGYIVFFPIFGSYLLMSVCFSNLQLHKAMRFGDLSYGTYLCAFPLQQLVVQRMTAPYSRSQLFLIVLPLILSYAAISWYAIERPVLRLAHRKKPHQAVPAMTALL